MMRLQPTILRVTGIAIVLWSFSLLIHWLPQRATPLHVQATAIEKYLARQEAIFDGYAGDTALLHRLWSGSETEIERRKLTEAPTAFFLLDSAGALRFWNSQSFSPDPQWTHRPPGIWLQRFPNGYHLVRLLRKTIGRDGCTVVGIIPVRYQYDFQHSLYLKSSFAHDRNASSRLAVSTTPVGEAVQGRDGATIFWVAHAGEGTTERSHAAVVVLQLAGLLFLGIAILMAGSRIGRDKLNLKSFLSFLAVLTAVRLLLYALHFTPGLFTTTLFNPALFGSYSSILTPSLGDLLLNLALPAYLVHWLWLRRERIPQKTLSLPLSYALGLALAAIWVGVSFESRAVLASLVADSSISFDVVNYFSLDAYTGIAFGSVGALCLLYFLVSRLLLWLWVTYVRISPFLLGLVLPALGLVWLSLGSTPGAVPQKLGVLLWLSAYALLLVWWRGSRYREGGAALFLGVAFFAFSVAVLLSAQTVQRQWRTMESIAEKNAESIDPSSEHTLSVATTYLDNDFLVGNWSRLVDPVSSRWLRDSITASTFSGYLRNYDTRLFLFDSLNRGVHNEENRSFAELNTLYTVESKPTSIPGLHYHDAGTDSYRYITRRDFGVLGPLGTLFVMSTPRRYNPDALYPELFRKRERNAEVGGRRYHYAVYKSGRMVGSSGAAPFTYQLTAPPPEGEWSRLQLKDRYELWYRPSLSTAIVVSAERSGWLETLTLFSYLFCLFVLGIAVVQLGLRIFRWLTGDRSLPFWQWSIRSRVHTTIILISILSFAIISTVTIDFFTRRYTQTTERRLGRTAEVLAEEMQKRLEDARILDDVVRIYDTVSRQTLENLMGEVARLHNVDVNVYDTTGHLQVSSEPDIYKRSLLSRNMQPMAFYALQRQQRVQWSGKERLGSLEYLSISAPVRDREGAVYAYLQIPYFLSQIDIQEEISHFLVTVVNLTAAIFLIAGLLSLFLTARITRTFNLIGEKMRELRLGKRNQKIDWQGESEIGALVHQYNRMVEELEKSAAALAKSEREGAWQEMARQVAHEIKNPLTPIKLSMQYLQRAADADPERAKGMLEGVTKTVIEQIEHLSRIASDFAQFANIGYARAETFDLHEVLQSLYDLHRQNPQVRITWKKMEGPLLISADKTHMNRVFTNLLTNAVEACPEVECRIELGEERVEGGYKIWVSDNGNGIPEEVQTNIFQPNFTTKSAGTGLGLAMSKRMVEAADGTIGFITGADAGTTFWVQLPTSEPLDHQR